MIMPVGFLRGYDRTELAVISVQLLGPVQVTSPQGVIDAGPARQRCVLAALAVDAGHPVAAYTLIDRVWGEHPPQRARHTLDVYLSRLRSIFRRTGPAIRIVRRSGGYALDIEDGAVDMAEAEAALVRASQRGVPTAAQCDALESALKLWRGRPLADLQGSWADCVRDLWEQRRLDALIQWSRVRLTFGRFDAVLGGLASATMEFPLAEPLWAARMRALVAAERRSEALVMYESARSRLADELGIDPGPELTELHRALLRS